MAAAGVASRRVSEDLIAAGRVTVNGEVVTEPGRRIDPDDDQVAVDGTAVQLDTTQPLRDAQQAGRRRRARCATSTGAPTCRGSPPTTRSACSTSAGSTPRRRGLLILTNDGELAHVLAHPSFGVTKTYIARVRGVVTPQTIAQLTARRRARGRPDRRRQGPAARAQRARRNDSLVEITLHSGRNRIVRRMMAEVGHPVIELVRRQFGPLHLGTLEGRPDARPDQDRTRRLLTISRDATAVPRVDAIPTTESADAPVDEADVVEVALDETEVEKEYYDEDDDEFDPDTDARDAKRRRGPSGFKGDAVAPASRRAEVRREQAGRREQRTGFDAPEAEHEEARVATTATAPVPSAAATRAATTDATTVVRVARSAAGTRAATTVVTTVAGLPRGAGTRVVTTVAGLPRAVATKAATTDAMTVVRAARSVAATRAVTTVAGLPRGAGTRGVTTVAGLPRAVATRAVTTDVTTVARAARSVAVTRAVTIAGTTGAATCRATTAAGARSAAATSRATTADRPRAAATVR